MTKKPRFWEQYRGKILSAIILHEERNWQDIKSRSGLSQKQLYKQMGWLLRDGIVTVDESTGVKMYSVADKNLIESYRAYDVSLKDEQRDTKKISPTEKTQDYRQFLEEWVKQENISTSLEHSHFFLAGPELTRLTGKLIKLAQKSILVVNPFVDKAGLGISLRDATKRGVKSVLITRDPKGVLKRKEFHETLQDAGMSLFYSGEDPGGVHSKLLVVDDDVAIVSSLNFTSSAEAAVSWETGVVTFSKEVVNSVIAAIDKFMKQDETKAV